MFLAYVKEPYKVLLPLVGGVALQYCFFPTANIGLQVLRARLFPPESISPQVQDTRPTGQVVSHVDGPGATVSVVDLRDGTRNLLINGILTSTQSGQGAGETMVNLPLLLQEHPLSALIICLGAGDAARAAVQHLKNIDPQAQIEIVELQKEVVDAIPLFQPDGGATLRQEGVHIYVRDGRHHLLMSQRQYDLIVIDTTPPFYGAGAVNLYSRDFQELAKQHLTSTGMLVQWLPGSAFESNLWACVKGSVDIFPYQRLWVLPGWYGAILWSSKSPIPIDYYAFKRRLAERGLDKTKAWITTGFLQAGLVDPDWVRGRVAHETAVTDDNPSTEFPLDELLRGAPLIGPYSDIIPAEARTGR
jgi:spermidine synthase